MLRLKATQVRERGSRLRRNRGELAEAFAMETWNPGTRPLEPGT
jgi:hypothetical protein